MLVQHLLEGCAGKYPDKVALVCGGQRFTYREVEAMANRLAWALRDFGVRRGDRVGIYLHNSPELVVAMFAILKCDAVFVSAARTTRPDRLVAMLADCGPSAIITDGRAVAQGLGQRLSGEVKSIRDIIHCRGNALPFSDGLARYHAFEAIQTSYAPVPPPGANIDLDLACLIYTSGTTGETKGVMCDHSNVLFVTHSVVEYLEHTQADIILSVLPLAYSYGLYQLLTTFCQGGTLVLEESFAFPEAVLERMSAERVTGFAGVPMIFSRLLTMSPHRFDLSALRYLTNAAAGLPVEHAKRLRQLFPRVKLYLMHGLTEVARTMYLPPDQVEVRPDSSGKAMPGTELWIEDEAGRRLGPGEVGELVVRGRNVMRGYWNAPGLTAERFRSGTVPGERICYSGDLFRTDAEGYFYFVSRKDDIIKSRGEKVAPCQIENVLYTIPGVQDAAVIGIPDPLLGQAVKAFIVAPGTNLTEAKVLAYCKAALDDFMVPRQVAFLNELPKTGSGKVRRMDLIACAA